MVFYNAAWRFIVTPRKPGIWRTIQYEFAVGRQAWLQVHRRGETQDSALCGPYLCQLTQAFPT